MNSHLCVPEAVTECESAPRAARRLLLSFDTGEALVALLSIRYGLLLLGAVFNDAIFAPFLFRALQTAAPPAGAREWGTAMFAWGVWAFWGVCCGIRSNGCCYNIRKATMMSGLLLWIAVTFALVRAGQPIDAWLTYPLLVLACFLKYLRLCARQKAGLSEKAASL